MKEELEEVSLPFLGELNRVQREAVMSLMGPSLIIAGAGSGKTKVLTCKIANILSHGFPPYSIMALTFTNKAAREMKKRIGEMVGERLAKALYAGTFHSIFLRFLSQYAEFLGYPKGFTILDKGDQKSLVKRCIKELNLDDKVYKPADVSSRISECKNNLITAQTYISYPELMESDRKTKRGKMHQVFALYTQRCEEQGIMDFDDLLLNMYKLICNFPEQFDTIRKRFQFILVDEYQDTNQLQYLILKALAQEHRNITVVGDDAQSIYAFRGARIENILNFQKDYPDAKLFRLERNYRSTQTIVDAANSVINRNRTRLTKECYSEREKGDKIQIIPSYTEKEEAYMVAASILALKNKKHLKYQDFAVLYRTNSQSRLIEEALRSKNIPFKIYQGHSFFDRTEIKNMASYLRLIVNPKDDESFKRVVNFPSRGIGAVSMERIISLCRERSLPLMRGVIEINAEEFNVRGATLNKIRDFAEGILAIGEKVQMLDAYEIAKIVNERFEITKTLALDNSLDGQTRLDNVQEFFNSIKSFVEEGVEEYVKEGFTDGEDEDVPIVTLDLYLQNIALIADADVAKESSEGNKTIAEKEEEENNRVSLMTVHSAKGLEFPYIYIVGLEENLFPSGGSYFSSEKDIEEERRLFYVALTRAKEGAMLSFANQRMQFGDIKFNSPSRFLKEIDRKYLQNPEVLAPSESKFGNPFANIFPNKFGPVTTFNSSNSLNSSSNRGLNSGSNNRFKLSKSKEHLPPKPSNFKADSPLDMRAGQRVEHERFGLGVIISISGEDSSKKAIVEFEKFGTKTLMLKFAKMKIIDK